MKTKLPKATRLPSGSFRCQVTAPDGKRISVTAETAQEAQAKAVAIKAGIQEKQEKRRKITLSDAIQDYIDNKSSVLSPSTIRGYNTCKKYRFGAIMKMDIYKITKNDVQIAVNEEAKIVSPKTIYNAYGLIRPVLKEHGVDVFGIKLPQRVKKKPAFVQPEELKRFFDALENDECSLPIIMALWLGMRRSEILGLCWDCVDIERGTVTVRRVLIPDEENQWVLRDGAKNESSQRTIEAPAYIMERLDLMKSARLKPLPEDRVFRMHPDTIRRHVHRACEKAGITDTTIHGLRHTNAAVMRHIGVSDAFAMERGGWTNERTYKDTYSYVFGSSASDGVKKIDDFFSKRFEQKLHTKTHTEK